MRTLGQMVEDEEEGDCMSWAQAACVQCVYALPWVPSRGGGGGFCQSVLSR